MTLAALGSGTVLWGLFGTRQDIQTKDLVWLGLGGAMSVIVLCLALFSPGLLNARWALAAPVAKSDTNLFVRVPRDQPQHKGKPLADGEVVDGRSEAIRQDDVVLRLESVTIGPLAGKGEKWYVQVHCRVLNAGQSKIVTFQGFGPGTNHPVLTDAAGRSYRFLEHRPRTDNATKGPPTFGDALESMAAPVVPTAKLDSLLVFDFPTSGGDEMKLEIPASVWGGEGKCRLSIAAPFEASGP
jgi:hypothetical protein